MNFKQWFNEAVEYRHENAYQFFRKSKNRLNFLFGKLKEENLDAIQKNLKKLMPNGENECTSIMANWADSAYSLIDSYKNRLNRMYSSPSDQIDAIAKDDGYAILRNIEQHGTNFWSMKPFLQLDTNWHSYQELYDFMMEKMTDPESQGFVERYCGKETEIVFDKAVNDMKQFLSTVENIKTVVKSFDNQMAIRARAQQKYALQASGRHGGIREIMPEHEPFEYLYHASSNVPAIMREGFKTKKELGRQPTGLGGGSSELISFTSNPKIAQAIAKGIKYIVRIAKKEITFDDVVAKYKRLGIISDEDVEHAKFLHSDPIEQTISLYRLALIRMQEKGLAYNPWFGFSNFNEFAKTNIKDVGIVKAKIDMSKVKEYMPAEAEYRVPVDAISDISVVS
jgi:hypothetical protein